MLARKDNEMIKCLFFDIYGFYVDWETKYILQSPQSPLEAKFDYVDKDDAV